MAQLIGYFRLGRDAELRNLPDGTAVANLSLAYNYGQKSQDGKKPSQWVDGSLWGVRAESLYDYLMKGQGLCCTIDDVHVESFTKADGTAATKLVGKVSQIEFAGSPTGQAATPAPRAPAARHPAPQAQLPAHRQAPRRQAPAASSGFDDMDSDMPF
jgi:single-strand DNA-binding protein